LPAAKENPEILKKSLEYYSIEVASVFPSLRSQYEEIPIGYATIKNTGHKTLTDLKASFIIRQYMDAPKECLTVDRLDPGKSVQVPLYALFNDSILGITETTKVSGQIIINRKGIEDIQSATVQVYDRNALTWSDDQKAAAFVSSKDPWVMDLTGNIMATAMPVRNPELSGNLQTAMAIHEGLRAYGISYMLSPNRPFAKEVVDTAAVDTLKFPRQTLGFRAGDCADLSVLYASCFEAAGIETAFVTVPGHIFIAADLKLNASQAADRGMDIKELIVQDDKVWLPIETTMRSAGFSEVWRKGAEQWRNASKVDLAALYPIHKAWTRYAPVGLPADGSTVRLPQSEDILKSFKSELALAVNKELTARINLLGPLEKGASYTTGVNNRGVLYGKYGYYSEAAKQFEEAAKAGNTSALVNLGNISMLQSDAGKAYGYYQKAAVQMPRSPRLQVNLARAAAALGNQDDADSAMEELRKLDPELANQYAYVAIAPGSSITRASEAVDDSILWF
jgi:tetratricopeptide (TPR) repeat protein